MIKQAIAAMTQNSSPPKATSLVMALLEAEKQAKRTKLHPSFADLLGTWQLGFITGTKRSQKRAGVVLGTGRFLPNWLGITLSYHGSTDNDNILANGDITYGTIKNCIHWGGLRLIVSGPARLWPHTSIVAFDFTRIHVRILGQSLYSGTMRGGKIKEAEFPQKPLKSQAFFNYFLIDSQCLAARGRGGGLALWAKRESA